MITFERYWPLLFVAAIPFVFWVRGRTLTDFNTSQLRLATLIRSSLVVLLALAMMQPVVSRSGSWLSVVYVLDVSQSVSPQAISSAIDWIEAANATGRPDHAGYVGFGANAIVHDSLDALRTMQVADRLVSGSVDQSGTNLEEALNSAIGSFSPNHIKRVVLLSDGNENSGTVKDTILRLQQEGVQVFARPIQARLAADAWVEDLLAPARVTSDELFPVEVHVFSHSQTSARVDLRLGDEVLEGRDVVLVEGINRIAFEVRVEDAGPTTLEAEVRAGSDSFAGNNLYRESIVVGGSPRVLYVEGRPQSAGYLTDALEMEGLEVVQGTPAALPRVVEGLDGYEAVILSDVRADAMSPAQMEALATYVEDLGGGFILAGGDSVFGEEGYSMTRVEEILPVSFDLEEEEDSVSLIIVLDKSGSMGGQKIELAKEASKAAVDVLLDDHMIGIIAFDYNHYWPVQLQPAANRSEINRSVSMIIAGGETNIYPALREARASLLGVEAKVKHVILLSDGRSLPDDYQGLVDEMADAQMTVSTVAVGNGADRELLEDIAEWGKGRAYFIEDATMVPQIFTEETELATQGTLEEEPFQAIVVNDAEVLNGIDFLNAPLLLGYVSTLAKDTAEVLLESDSEKPILARWQYGLGKTAVFTSDVKDRWAVDWLAWNGYMKLWPQLVRETMRRQDDEDLEMRIEKQGGEARITITALDSDGGFRNELDSQIRVIDPDQSAAVIEVRQSGPGTYEARYPIDQDGSFVFRLIGDEAGVSRILPYSYPEEYHFYPADVDLLREVSESTGGRFGADESEIFSTGSATVTAPTPIWPYLAAMALLLYLSELYLRRVRLFESRDAAPVGRQARATPRRGSLGIS